MYMYTSIYVCVYVYIHTHTSPLQCKVLRNLIQEKTFARVALQGKFKQNILLDSSVNWREGTETGALIRQKRTYIFSSLQFDRLQT